MSTAPRTATWHRPSDGRARIFEPGYRPVPGRPPRASHSVWALARHTAERIMGLKRPARYKVLPFAAVAHRLPAGDRVHRHRGLDPQRPDPAADLIPGPGPLLRVHHRGHHPVRRPGRARRPLPRQAVPLPRRLPVLPAQPLHLPAGQGDRRGRRAPAGHARAAAAAADRPGAAKRRASELRRLHGHARRRSWPPGCRCP